MPDGRLAVLTGGGSGIGLEVAQRLHRRGFRLVLVDRTTDLAQSAAATIGPSAMPVACDLADRDAVQDLSARIATEWSGQLELLVCNAGVVVPGQVGALSPKLVDCQLDVMLGSAMHLISAGTRVLRARDRGHILATVSMGGILALPGSAAYSAAKFGLRAYLAALHCELRDTNVHVSGIYPSAVDTPMLRHEATHGGSLLNFVGSVSPVGDVADAYERALDTRHLEVYVPYSDSLLCRAFGSAPWTIRHVVGPFERIGRRGREKYLAER